MSIKVYADHGNPRGQKVLITARFAGLEVEQVPVNFFDIKQGDYIAKNPNGKMPIIETERGILFESNAIIRYFGRLAESRGLYGSSTYEHSLIDQWLDWICTELEPVIFVLLYPILGFAEYNNDVYHKSRADLKRLLGILDNHLKHNTYLVGQSITIADIALTVPLAHLLRLLLTQKDRTTHPSVIRLIETVANQKEFKSIFGRLIYCSTEYPTATLSK